MKEGEVSVDGLTWRKPDGRYVEEIELDEHVDTTIERGRDSEQMLMFRILGIGIHQGAIDAERLNAYVQRNRLKPVVESLLVKAGWKVHIVDPLKRSETEDYIHSTGGTLQVFQVLFSAEWNIGLRSDELCKSDGSIRLKGETLERLKERIGVDTFNLEHETKDTCNHVLAILAAEGLALENLHDVNGQELTIGAQEFRWFRDDGEAEDEAREYLTDDDYLWKEAVAAGSTTDGLGEWAEDVLNMDGWEHVIGGYDGEERIAQLKDGTWFPYIRVN